MEREQEWQEQGGGEQTDEGGGPSGVDPEKLGGDDDESGTDGEAA